jgi:hypothetical protein
MTGPAKPDKKRKDDKRKTEKYTDDPKRKRQRDEPSNPETNTSAKSIPIEDLNAENDK